MITLPWADEIRKRLKEYEKVKQLKKDLPQIKAFIGPILKYAEDEEKRITKEFEEER